MVDAGLAAREIDGRLASMGADGSELHGILVTHEHGDHCRGLGPVARRHRLPVYLHPETRRAASGLGKIDDLREFESGGFIHFRDLEAHAFPLTHDAAAPVGFTIETGEGKIGIATDLGIATRLVADRLRGCRVLILEFNHDEEMLRDGPYPWPLKQRIRSHHGHLSNREAAALLGDLLWEGLEAVFLAHLSETNNRPALAERCARAVLDAQNLCGPRIFLGCQHTQSVCLTL